MKRYFSTFCLAYIGWLGCCLVSCNDNSSQYEKGYESAWNGEKEPSSIWTSRVKREGYQQGVEDAGMYDEGYYDGKKGSRPTYFRDAYYMEGYRDGKKQR